MVNSVLLVARVWLGINLGQTRYLSRLEALLLSTRALALSGLTGLMRFLRL